MAAQADGGTQAVSVQQKIQRVGRALSILCTVAKVVLVVTAVGGFIGIGAAYTGHPAAQSLIDEAAGSGIVHLIGRAEFMASVPERERLMIQFFTFALAQFFMLALITQFKKMADDFSRTARPFTYEAAAKLRRQLWWIWLIICWNIIVGLILCTVVLLISYLIEYGAYLQDRADETSRIQEEMIVSFAEITENKSGQTGQHIRRVSEYARVLADELGLPPERVEQIRLASTMHDVGKLLIPSEILDKPGRLTDEEFAVIKQHTTYGGQLLENVEGDEMQLSRTIALQHHERYDGHGYPAGLSAEDISLEGRIVAVADVYDALTSRRSYKDAWDDREAYDEIVRCSGTQFDPAVVAAFERRYADINAIRARFADAA